METVSIVLFFLAAVVVSGAVSRMLPVGVPAPLVQILLGAVIGLSSPIASIWTRTCSCCCSCRRCCSSTGGACPRMR